MDVEKLYDEFGNYIGPDKSDDESDDSEESLELPPVNKVQPSLPNEVSITPGLQLHEDNEGNGNLNPPGATAIHDESSAVGPLRLNDADGGVIIQAEDKQLYPRADEVFGSGTEVLVEEEDAQPLSEPLVAAPEERTSGLYETADTVPEAKYSRGYLARAIAPFPVLVRNVAIAGHIHHGKTSLVDMLFCGTHDMSERRRGKQQRSLNGGEQNPTENDRDTANSTYDEDDGDNNRRSPLRYTDLRVDERQLGISIKTGVATLLLQNSDGKSYGVTVLDTPGHMNFRDEVAASLTIADGLVVVVDVAEGVMMGSKSALREAARLGLSIVLVISKLDRLCLELRLPPTDAYHKIQHIIDACNEIISSFPNTSLLSPIAGNVCFASASERVCFTLPQFARSYIRVNGGEKSFPLTARQLARRMWGNIYYDVRARKFCERSTGYSTGGKTGVNSMNLQRTFVSFVLEPFYKLHTAVVSEDVDELSDFLKRNMLLAGSYATSSKFARNGHVRKSQLNSNLHATLKAVNSQCFGMGDLSGFTDMLVEHVQSPADSGERILRTLGRQMGMERDLGSSGKAKTFENWQNAVYECDTSPECAMSAYVAKLAPDERGLRFDCVCRVLSGRIDVGSSIHIMGPSSNNTADIGRGSVLGSRGDDGFDNDEDDMTVGKVEGLYLNCARFKIRISHAVAGQIVLVRGIDRTIDKSATLVSKSLVENLGATLCRTHALRNVTEFIPPPVVKVAVEPIKPAHLPKMVSALRMCVSAYPGLVTRVEHTGEHVLMGSGELYLDCVLRDLRESFGKVEVKVSDPVVPFAETVSETSALQCASDITTYATNDTEDADDDSRKGRLVTVAEPLEESIVQAIGNRQLETADETQRARVLRDLGWDALAAKSLWTFGPDEYSGTNALLNDVLGNEDRQRAVDLRDSVVQGFCWAMREGPLCDEPVRGVKVRVLNATPPSTSGGGGGGGGGVIATSRRVIFSSILTACPQMLEPINEVEIILPTEAVRIATTLVTRRRGLVVAQEDIAATPLVRMTVHMPVLDSFGFEPDLRSLTHGAAFCSQSFSNWRTVPGDPLDRSISLRPLEPAARHELAREVMIKTRRRKGLGDDVSVTKFLDDPLFAELAAVNEELRRLI